MRHSLRIWWLFMHLQLLQRIPEGRKLLPLWSFHQYRRRNTSIESRKALILDNLLKAIDHSVVAFSSNALPLLQLPEILSQHSS